MDVVSLTSCTEFKPMVNLHWRNNIVTIIHSTTVPAAQNGVRAVLKSTNATDHWDDKDNT